jgi:DeoR/GlpR family transcriptional regulator of sugar metabolism
MGHGFELRKRTILDRLEREGSILVKEIADELTISETTIRRDLNELHSAGLLKQVYGGAVRIDKNAFPVVSPITARSTQETESKKRIGECAASLVNDGDVVYIDPGTTSWEMIPFIKDRKNLTIISNSVRLLLCLDSIRHHTIVQLGGALRPDRLDTVGSITQIGVDQLRGYKAFQGGDGLDLIFGLSAIDHESAMTAKAILSNAKETIILADHTKFENPSLLYKIVDIERINTLVTDKRVNAAWEEKCASANIRIVYSEPDVT